MKKKSLILFQLLIVLCSCKFEKSDFLLIATSANMQFAMEELIETFTEETQILCEPVVSSSGKLTAQIIQGAPYHVFVSADMKYPKELHEKGFTLHPPEIYAFGKLILWSSTEDIAPDIESMTSMETKYIAIANPKTAPYGKAAKEMLEHYGILQLVEDKLVYGESISQVNQFITSKSVDLGFTTKASSISPAFSKMSKWMEIDSIAYSPIKQGIAILKSDELMENNARRFYQFIFSAKGKAILSKYGYEIATEMNQ